MAVPETAVNQNHGVPAGQDDVRSAWQISTMQSEAEAKAVQKRAHSQLRAGIPGSDSSHVPAAVRTADAIHHSTPLRISLTVPASCRASSGGTAFPTCRYWDVRVPAKK